MLDDKRNTPMLEAKKLSKSFGQVEALIDLDLEVASGEILCLLGANGAGKTTTINLFLGFLEPTSGSAWVDGLETTTNALEIKRKVAYIPEQVNLYRNLSGVENLGYFTELAGHRPSEDELLAILTDVGLAPDEVRRRVSSYSKGMRQKVGVAIAIAKNAKALLLDEPTSGLDPKAAGEFSALLQDLAAQGVAVLMTTHDLLRAKEVGHRLGIMRSGRLVDLLDTESVEHRDLESLYLRHMHAEAQLEAAS